MLFVAAIISVGCSDDDASSGGSAINANGSGGGGLLDGCRIFPGDNPWNQDISKLDVHPDSDTFIDSIGRDIDLHPDFGTELDGAPRGIPYVVVGAGEEKVPIEFTLYGDQSDPGPYPIPRDAPIEGGPDSDGDRHVLVVDTSECKLYELYRAFPKGNGSSWEAESGAVFDLTKNDDHPERWTSADAAGLPVLPGLARYDEVVTKGAISHALRFTVSNTQTGYIYPARHYAGSSDDPSLPPMGLRVRMKALYDCSLLTEEVQVLCTALKKYGMILADNGSDWFISGAPDDRWDDDALFDLKSITGDAFEAVYTGEIKSY